MRSNKITDVKKFKPHVIYATCIILTLSALHWVIVKDILEIDLLLLFFEDKNTSEMLQIMIGYTRCYADTLSIFCRLISVFLGELKIIRERQLSNIKSRV